MSNVLKLSFPDEFHIIPCRSGRLLVFPSFPSSLVTQRTVHVWLPPGYGIDPEYRYPVIYAHDGQNLFIPECSFAGIDWGLDEALSRLGSEGVTLPLVVAIWNTPHRYCEYDPQQVYEQLLTIEEQTTYAAEHGCPASDLYLRFIVEELKPYLDVNLPTLTGPENTFMIGSSMGGLISAYALCNYPDIFGGVACISTHWTACYAMMLEYCRKHLPPPGNHKLYFDYGTETDDAPYEPYQLEVDALLHAIGYRRGIDWLTLKFPGAEHSEQSWRRRVDIPLRFLLT